MTRKRRQHLAVAVLLDVHVEKELDERARQARGGAREDRESRARDLGGALEVEDAERRAEVPVRLGLEVEPARLSPRALDAVRGLVGASREPMSCGTLGTCFSTAASFRSASSTRSSSARISSFRVFISASVAGSGFPRSDEMLVAAAALLLEAGHRFAALGVEIRIGLEAGASEALRHLPQQACRVLA